MPMWRVRTADGRTRPVSAGRVVVADGEVRFQSPGTGGWVTVEQAALASVVAVDRRFNEADGRVRWVPETEVVEAADAARPEPRETARETEDAPPEDVRSSQPTRPVQVDRPTAAVSARDVRCPQCGEQEELSGRRVDGEILLTCDRCGYDGPRVARRTCPTCGGDDVVERPKALVERSRGTQLSVVGYTTVGLCRQCDADALAAALAHGGAVMPDELPTVDPDTLRTMRKGRGPA
jgi:Zn ribbon nucleic-acid-binding protein